MRYTDEIIEEVREKNDIVDVISQYVRLQRRGSNYMGLCPFHNEKTPSFSVSREKQLYYCFGCGKGGNVITFVMEYNNYSFQEALQYLADRAGVKLPELAYSKEAQEKADRRAKLLEINKLAAEYFYHKLRSPAGSAGMAYLTGRGLTSETMRSFGLGFADKYRDDLYRFMKQKGYRDDILKDSGLFLYDERYGASDKFWNRVMYPIMDANSRVIGFGGRVMGDGKPKYLNSPETEIFNKRRNLYGLNVARRTKRKNFIICEGYMDVITMHQAGYTNAVASLGTALTDQQCSLMSRFTKEVLVIYDMDGAGVTAALRAIPMLRSAGLSTKVVNLRPHKDPDEFIKAEGAEAFEKRLEEAENSFYFIVRHMEDDYDMNDPGGKSAFLHAVAGRLLEIEDEIERKTYTDAIARKYRIDPEVLQKEIGRQALKGVGRTEIRTPKPAPSRKVEAKVNSSDRLQKLMLTWLSDRPELIGRLGDTLGPEDFVNPMYREVAKMVWEQAASGKISPASIINHFTDAEEQSEVASLFNTNMPLETDDEKKQAFFDVLCRLKRQSLDAKAAKLDPSDLQGFLNLTKERQKLDKFAAGGIPKGLF